QLVDETPKGNTAADFVLPRELSDMHHVRERLLPSRSQDESDVRSCLGEQPVDRIGDRSIIPAAMQLLQEAQRIGNRAQMPDRIADERELLPGVAAQLFRHAEGVKDAKSMPKLEQLLIVYRKERAFQRREHRQLIVGPFDCGERRANGFDLRPAVERLAADEQMRNA